jgi:hypothetical protein
LAVARRGNNDAALFKGVVDDVYSDELGVVAYQASCFVNVSFGSDIK